MKRTRPMTGPCPKGHTDVIIRASRDRRCKECARIYARRYAAEHREELLPKWRERSRLPKNRALAKVWQIAHPKERATNENRRRARKAANGGSHTHAEWLEKCALLGNVCIYCGESKPLTRDHNIPLSRGGTDDITKFVHFREKIYVTSTNVAAAQYDRADQTLMIWYNSGAVWQYGEVSEAEAISFMTAPSKGSWCWDHLKIRGSRDQHQKPAIQIA